MKYSDGPNSEVKQHKRMAMGQDIGAEDNETFGMAQHDHTHKPNSEPMGGRKALKGDGTRGIKKASGFHPAPDHGPFE